MATRMVGGFILVALLFCILLAWPGHRRWPVWLIAGLTISLCAALTASLVPGADAWWTSVRLLALILASGFCTAAAVLNIKDLS